MESEDNRYYGLLNSLFQKAFSKNPFDTLCSLLRAGGMSDANWDPFEESRKALEDYNWILEKTRTERSEISQIRIALLMYCQLIEMTTPHEIMTNLLGCIDGEGYKIQPLRHLGRTFNKKKKPSIYVPPSAKTKFRYIKEQAVKCNEFEFKEAIEDIYSDNIRNSFTHSDYVLTDEFFRYTENGISQQIPVEELIKTIMLCFDFYSEFMKLHRLWLIRFSKGRRYHQWPRYEVLELLSDDNGVYGFNVHFSNGCKATYSRREEGIVAMNVSFAHDGGINFYIGSSDKLEPVWKIDGQPVIDWNELP